MTRLTGKNNRRIMNTVLKDAVKHWSHVAPLVSYPTTAKEFDNLVTRLDELLDIISLVITTYEQNH
jgi:hypothetical protein